MKSKEGKYPVNARVSIDYSKGEPKIRFGYPRKPTRKDVVRQNAGTGIFFYLSLILLVFLPISYLIQVSQEEINGFDKSTMMIIICFYLIIKILPIGIFKLDEFLARYYTRWKWYQKFQPKFQAWKQRANKKRAYYAKFKKEDIKNNEIEIPLFKNIKLEYKTSGDFSNKLLKIDIREHDFLEKVIVKKKPDKKSMKQVWLWKAKFKFRELPKDGYMEVWFK